MYMLLRTLREYFSLADPLLTKVLYLL